MKQLWKKFDKLTEICYMSELEDNCPQWDEAYEVFKQLVAQGREKDPQYAAEILKMDDATDFCVWCGRLDRGLSGRAGCKGRT